MKPFHEQLQPIQAERGEAMHKRLFFGNATQCDDTTIIDRVNDGCTPSIEVHAKLRSGSRSNQISSLKMVGGDLRNGEVNERTTSCSQPPGQTSGRRRDRRVIKTAEHGVAGLTPNCTGHKSKDKTQCSTHGSSPINAARVPRLVPAKEEARSSEPRVFVGRLPSPERIALYAARAQIANLAKIAALWLALWPCVGWGQSSSNRGGNITVPTEVYDATGWNADLSVPTKDAVRDKIEALVLGGGGIGGTSGATDNVLLMSDGTGGATISPTVGITQPADNQLDVLGHSAFGNEGVIDGSPQFFPIATFKTIATFDEVMTTTSVDRVHGTATWLRYNPSGATSTNVTLADGDVEIAAGNAQNVPYMAALAFSNHHHGTGIVAEQQGLSLGVANDSTGTVTDQYGIYTATGNNGAGGTVTNSYALYVAGMSSATKPVTNFYGAYIETAGLINSTNIYGIYQKDSNATNYFNGKLAVGATTAAAKVDVTGNTVVRLGITDTSLIDAFYDLDFVTQAVQNNSNTYWGNVYATVGNHGTGFSTDYVKSRSANGSSAAVVQDTDDIASFNFHGDDGTDLGTLAAAYYVSVDGTPAANIVPARFDWWTMNSAGGSAPRFSIRSSGRIGVGINAPDKQLEINSATGENLRLTYNDSNGSAANYTDFEVSSSGDLTVTPSGDDVTVAGDLMSETEVIVDVDGGTYAAADVRSQVYCNTGDTDGQTVNLPAAVTGMTVTFFCTVAQNIIINPDTADVIILNGIAPAAGDSITGGAAGESITLTAIDDTNWAATAIVGSWVDSD